MPIALDGASVDLGPLNALVDRARLCFLVEMDHFIHEKYGLLR